MDTYLTFTSAFVQALVILLLVRKRIYKDFPLFSAYLVWVFAAAFAASFAASKLNADTYKSLYLASSAFDAVFMFSVLVELSMSVLTPVKSVLPRWTIFLVAGVLGVAAVGAWSTAVPPGLMKLSTVSQYIIHFDLATSILRIMFFVTLAALSQLLALGWRNRVVQIATGLGFFSLVSLGVTFLHMNQGVGVKGLNDLYHALDRIVVCSYIGSMVYWLFYFAKDEPKRHDFTPPMQKFITSLAQNARSTRLAMKDSDFKSGGVC